MRKYFSVDEAFAAAVDGLSERDAAKAEKLDRKPAGRKPAFAVNMTARHTMRLTPAQDAVFARLGGVKWLRDYLEKKT